LSNPQPPRFSLWIWIQDHWASSLSVLGPFALASSSIWQMVDAGKWQWTFGSLTILGVGMSLSGGIAQIALTPGNKTLQMSLKQSEDERGKLSQNNQTSFRSAISDELLILYDILNLENSGRISFYHDDDVNKKLKLLGQYSRDRRFDEDFTYCCNYDEGALGVAWARQNGFYFEDNLPMDIESYCQMCVNQLNINIEVAQNLRIKSRTICIRPIKNFNRRKTSALVFESVNPQAGLFHSKQRDQSFESKA
jgi:hypothetical protein